MKYVDRVCRQSLQTEFVQKIKNIVGQVNIDKFLKNSLAGGRVTQCKL